MIWNLPRLFMDYPADILLLPCTLSLGPSPQIRCSSLCILKTELKKKKGRKEKKKKDWVVQTTKPKAFTERLRMSRHPTTNTILC